MKTHQDDKKELKHPIGQKKNEENRQNTGESKSEKKSSSKKANDEDEHDKKHKDYTSVLGLDKIQETY